MTLNYRSKLPDWLRELKLSEPELDLTIPVGDQTRQLLIAFPEFRFGIWEDTNESGKQVFSDWTLWGCGTDRTVRQALGQIAVLMGTITADQTGPDLSRLEMLKSQKLWEQAEEEVSRLLGSLDDVDPVLLQLKEYRKEIRREIRNVQGSTPVSYISQIGKPVSQVIREDIGRVYASNLPAHHFIGFFTQRNAELEGQIDAVWSANINSDNSTVWTGCAVGSETLNLDSSIEDFPTETELLSKLLIENDDNLAVWVWDRAQNLPILKRWHSRTTGKPLPDTIQNHLYDLRALSLIAFPTAQRSDNPENLCKELKIKYQDELGNGSVLAAMESLIQACNKKFQSSEAALQTAWKSLLQHHFSPEWNETFFPNSIGNRFTDYLIRLEETFRNLPEPVKSSNGQPKVEGLTLEDFFKKPDGFVAQVTGDGYEERKGQVEFAEQVLSGLRESKPYVLEAGTGIGKTKGYLIPLLLNGKRAYVATHTKNLQDQAWYKDVPEALKALEFAGLGRSVSILKGKNNYVCLQTIVDWLEDTHEFVRKQEDAFTLAAILHWLFLTETGWLIELGSLNNRSMIARLARDQAAPGLSETWGGLDPHKRALEAAKSVDIVLVNHSYIFARAKRDLGDEAPLDAIVFDEAHNIEDGVTEALTQDFKPWEVQAEISKLLDRTKDDKITGPFRPLLEFDDLKHRPIVKNFAQALFEVEKGIDEWCLLCSERFAELRDQTFIETGVDTYNEDPDNPILFSNDRFWIPNLLKLTQTLQQNMGIFKSYGENLLEELPRIKGVPKRMQSSVSAFIQHIDDNLQALQSILDFNDQDSVRWGEARVQVDEKGAVRLISNAPVWQGVLHSTPLIVSEWLRKVLYPKFPHTIFVSATLAMGERFENILSRLGLLSEDPEKLPSTHVFPSPFNYKDQVLLSVFSDSVFPANTTDTLYLSSLAENISQLAKLGEGRTLVLFTSRKTLKQVGLRLRAELEPDGILPLMQTEGNRAALIERFRQAPKVGEKLVLLGLRAFWEGVDIPGDPLRILVISRLPFDYYGHPIAIARKDQFLRSNPTSDYFHEVVIPGTFLHLRQMYGRLIRKEDDRGVCVFLDPRVADKRYGRYLLDLLPLSQRISAPRERNIEQIKRFFDGQNIASEYTDAVPVVTSAELSSEQLNIVNAPDKRILIRAAAGSGKTRVLSERIIRIIQEGKAPDPAKILALTYTVKAENVMKERLEDALGPKRSFEIERNILTYHKFAARIIRSDFQGTNNEINWINEESPEEKDLFTWVRSKSGISEDVLSKEDARTIVAFAQNGLVDDEQIKQNLNGFDPFTKKLAQFYLTYIEKMRSDNLLDYGEAIVKAVYILRNDVDKRQKWANKFDWIFCDEFQDTSPAQSRLLDLIGQQANLFVVGDSAQSIYSWMGADPDNLYQFENDFPGTIVYHLSKNFRSFPKLVRVSNRFLEQCGQKHGIRVIWDDKRSNENQNVFYLSSKTDRDEAKEVAILAKDALGLQIPGEPPPVPTVGVLARKWDLLKALEIELIRQEIPYDFEGDTARGIRKESKIQSIIDRALSLIAQAKGNQEAGDTQDGKLVSNLRNGQIKFAKELLENVKVILGISDQDYGFRNDFSKLLNALENKDPDSLTTIFEREENKAKVILSTVHSQKGEEFHTVFVIGLEKGNTPHQPPRSHQQILEWRKLVQKYSLASWQSDLKEDDLQRIYQQEEERIFYVAMTRARLNLIVGYSALRNQRKLVASEFLEKAKISGSVRDASGAYDIQLAVPPLEPSESGYRMEGRLYWTNAGIRVRSKSETMLANEFTRRGIFFEYELPPENISGALPDFTLPDYGGVIIEHLGLLDDDAYHKRWEQKSKEYELANRYYLATNESQIQDVTNTVDTLFQSIKKWVEMNLGLERIELIDRVELARRTGGFKVGKAVGDYMEGLFYLEDPTQEKVNYIDIRPEREKTKDLLDRISMTPNTDLLNWEEHTIEDIVVKISKTLQ